MLVSFKNKYGKAAQTSRKAFNRKEEEQVKGILSFEEMKYLN